MGAPLRTLIGLALVRAGRGLVPPLAQTRIAPLPAPLTVAEDGSTRGPYLSNRAMRRSAGWRGYGHGLGPMATSLRTRGRS